MTELRQRRVGAYAKLLANYASDDALIAAGEKAELLFVRGLAFLATSDSDGYITDAQVDRYVGAGLRGAAQRAQKLADVGVWERVDGGYMVRNWTKIHETAEEKGFKRRTDRERKRKPNPSGVQADSDRNPVGLTTEGAAESLLGSYVSSNRTTEQNTTGQDSAANPSQHSDATPTAQTLVAEWIDHSPKRPPSRVIGHVAKSLTALLDEGIDPADVRRGLATWAGKGLHPSALDSVVNEVMNTRPRTSSRASQKAQGWLNVDQQQPAIEGRQP